MNSENRPRALDTALLGLLLRLYPRRFRNAFGEELLALYERRRENTRERSGAVLFLLGCFLPSLQDLLFGAPAAWRDEWQIRPMGQPRPGEKTMKNLLQEARLTARVLFGRQRGFTALSVLTLALGLGATTAIFSVVNGVLLAPLPYGEPERIVRMYQAEPSGGVGFFAGLNFLDLRDRLESFEVIAGFYDYMPEGIDLTSAAPVERLHTLRVGSGYFEALGVAPLIGRTFERPEEVPPGAAERDLERFSMVTEPASPVVILSHGFWQRYFGGDTRVLGSTLELELKSYEIVGIMPAGLGGHVGGAPDVWLPLDLAPGGVNVPGNQYLSVVGRLAEGISLEQARAELVRETERLRAEQPRVNSDVQLGAIPLEERIIGPSRSMLGLLFAAVGAMLLIACINVANLFLVRGLRRRRELGLRRALGAGGSRLFASALIESLWVGVAGGVLGLGAAWLAVRWLQLVRPAALPRYDALGLHWPVVAFGLGAILLTVLLFGLWPAIRAARIDVRPAFGDRGGIGAGGRRERYVRDFGVSLQVALSLVLLTAGGLLANSFLGLHGTEMGFEADSSLAFRLRLPDYAYAEPETRIAFYDRLFERLGSLPELAASGATSKLPGNGHRNHWGFGIEGRERVEGQPFQGAEIRCVSGQSFEALGMPMLAGRSLSLDDRPESDRVVVVNRALIDAYFEGEDALGTRLRVGGGDPRTIVGIVGDARHDPREQPVPKIYVPQTQFATSRNWDLHFVATLGEGSRASWPTVRSELEAAVAEIDSRLVVYDVRPLAEIVAEPIARQKFGAQAMLFFAALSLLLAAVGLFGALAYSLGQRRTEFGVRMALGADRTRVLGSVLSHGLGVFASGSVLGLVGVFAISRWLESVLYEVSPGDPKALLIALATLFVATAIATLGPARRASRMDPAKILRGD